MKKLSLLVGAGIGFVLGSRSGRGPYRKLEGRFRSLLGRQDVQEHLGHAADAAPGPLGDVARKVTGALPDSGNGGPETVEETRTESPGRSSE